ncbi:metallophosphoesterase [Corynebacterium testudinoris]|uniref:Putative phosphohydrolase n=1 Tax=Corynebacterium testudinoris TaxID=136857 RepID=A0A0G3HAU6_9CORY|nr:metallophosphoesterase [Corynebacterium testudinoris]AKK09043.1 putative phosphohydrolase [Corynebacterium testudinoris]MBX8995447.1 metallophosphoesterase [Corynebacterium testudinoris]
MPRTLWVVSDLHVTWPANRDRVERLRPAEPGDWLIVAGDVAEAIDVVVDTLVALRRRFSRVIWTPGNHELFARSSDRFRGRERYRVLVDLLREVGVDTPEDPYPVFGDVTVAPLFTLYDYSFRPPGLTAEQALAAAAKARATLDDVLFIAPYVNIPEWCRERVDYSRRRLDAVEGKTFLVNHWPLAVEPTQAMFHPEMALWCGTTLTRDFPRTYQAVAVAHGHLHMPRELTIDGVPHFDVSLGYPFEQAHHPRRPWPLPGLRIAQVDSST